MVMKPESLVRLLFCLFAQFLFFFVLAGGTLVYAQRGGPGGAPIGPPPEPLQTQPTVLTTDQLSAIFSAEGKPIATNEYKCFLPPLNALQAATVGIVDLQVPEKTHQEYEDACSALQSKKLSDAERHLRKAIKQYAKYSAAWILLGQVLEAQLKMDDAREACSKPFAESANYLPAFLCLTDISARSKKWGDVLTYSVRVLELDPAANAAAYAYNATANLNLHHLPEAEKSALKAAQIDANHSEPRVYFLLAQIYAAMGDRSNVVAQLREYLKYAKDPDDVAVVKSQLAKLEVPNAK
jgi:tetratricopeptide (TPR) repeat protein